MTQKQNIRNLLVSGLVAVSFGGWLLHLRIHPPFDSPLNLIPFITGLLSIIVIPAMFFSKRTLAYAYVLNGMIVILGMITMGYISLQRLPAVLSFTSLVVGSLFADIVLLLTKFFLGKALFDLQMLKSADAPARTGRYWRYPDMGWWLVHAASMTAAFTAGILLWK